MVIRGHQPGCGQPLHQHEALLLLDDCERILLDSAPDPGFRSVRTARMVHDQPLAVEGAARANKGEVGEDVGDMEAIGTLRERLELFIQQTLPLMKPLNGLRTESLRQGELLVSRRLADRKST